MLYFLSQYLTIQFLNHAISKDIKTCFMLIISIMLIDALIHNHLASILFLFTHLSFCWILRCFRYGVPFLFNVCIFTVCGTFMMWWRFQLLFQNSSYEQKFNLHFFSFFFNFMLLFRVVISTTVSPLVNNKLEEFNLVFASVSCFIERAFAQFS